MMFNQKHTTRNIAIGSLIAAAGAGTAAYAIYRFTKGKDKNNKKSKCDAEDIKIGQNAHDVLLNKIGVTNSELEEAKAMNKTAYDLAKDKGFSEEQFKMFVNQERTRPIDELVLNRKITSEIGEQVKDIIVQHTNSWDGMLC